MVLVETDLVETDLEETVLEETDLVETARERTAPEETDLEEIGQVLMAPMATTAVDQAKEMDLEMVKPEMVVDPEVAGRVLAEVEVLVAAVVCLSQCLGPAVPWSLKVVLSPRRI
jgi:hypothetical protein